MLLMRPRLGGAQMTSTRDFTARVERRRQGRIALQLPFDPAAEWGERERYDVTGSVDGHKVRGKLDSRRQAYRDARQAR